MVTFKLLGFGGAAADLKRLGPKVGKAVRPVVRARAAKLVRDIKKAVPVDTGELRDSIQARIARDGESAVVVTDHEIARLIEFGGTRQDASPYFLSTAAQSSPAVQRAINAAIRKALQ